MRSQKKNIVQVRKLGRRLTRLRLEALEARRLLSVWADFNGDTFDDLAIGVPGEDIGSEVGAGAVNVIYGSASGLTATGNQIWDQNALATDPAEGGDQFGSALAAGDFNNDGFADLAVGVPFENISTISNAGAVNVLYGSAAGLSTTSQLWHQDRPRIRDVAETDDLFGWSVAAGDYNGDGFADMAVGVLGEDGGAGAVSMFYGGLGGLSGPGNQIFRQDTPGVPDDSETGDGFGFSLTAADFNGNGFDDLAIGVYLEDVGTAVDAGAVNVLYGSVGGLTGTGSQLWDANSLIIAVEAGARIGESVAAGDFDNDGFADLAIGDPREDSPIQGADIGVVLVVYGSGPGLTSSGRQVWEQDSTGVPGVSEAGDFFGQALSAGDFNGDGVDDLAIGVPGEDVGSEADAGAVNVIYGSGAGLSGTGSQIWDQDDLSGTAAQAGDEFGGALAAADFNGDGRDELAVGARFESIDSVAGAGGVSVIYGAALGLNATGSQAWNQDSVGILGVAQDGDFFGGALA